MSGNLAISFGKTIADLILLGSESMGGVISFRFLCVYGIEGTSCSSPSVILEKFFSRTLTFDIWCLFCGAPFELLAEAGFGLLFAWLLSEPCLQ